MNDVKGKLSRTYFREIGSFFLGFKYSVNLQKVCSQINKGIAKFLTKRHKNNRPSLSFFKD